MAPPSYSSGAMPCLATGRHSHDKAGEKEIHFKTGCRRGGARHDRHKIAAVASFMSLIVASVVAFQLTIAIDEAHPAGTQSVFSVTAINTPTKDAAAAAL